VLLLLLLLLFTDNLGAAATTFILVSFAHILTLKEESLLGLAQVKLQENPVRSPDKPTGVAAAAC
jgi:hypothetical protein